ncbi:MAG: hypothetical protein EPO12_18290 [Aquabacterium sp.]|nr:MAG: hypothetical protein EPO12_18290 [Aquabacterium sp.]
MQAPKQTSRLHRATLHALPQRACTSADADTVETLRRLLHAAHQGQVVGVAVAAIADNGSYDFAFTGKAVRRPVFMRGVLADMDDELGEMAKE